MERWVSQGKLAKMRKIKAAAGREERFALRKEIDIQQRDFSQN